MNQQFMDTIFNRHQKMRSGSIDKKSAETFVDNLFAFLFPQRSKPHETRVELALQYYELQHALTSLLFDLLHQATEAMNIACVFFGQLPELYESLFQDAQCVVQNDPATESLEEVLAACPGFYAIFIYRIAHQFHRQRVALLPRILSEYAHSKTGIDIHPGAVIGAAFFIDHGTGIVIGETAVIGRNVRIYQGVTIGALHVSKEKAGKKRHPDIGDGVVIYSGATILGGETTVGHDSIIGSNVWLTQSVAPYAVVHHKSHIVIRDKQPLPEPINFII